MHPHALRELANIRVEPLDYLWKVMGIRKATEDLRTGRNLMSLMSSRRMIQGATGWSISPNSLGTQGTK